jgi:hypothetical protein
MKSRLMAGISLAVGILALSGCAPPPAPQVAVAPAPAPPPVAVVASAPVVLVPAPPIVHRRVVHVARPVILHPPHRHYATRVYYAPIRAPGCGTTEHPCNVDHLTAPVQ